MAKAHLAKKEIEAADPTTWTDPEYCEPPGEVDLTTVYPAYVPSTLLFTPGIGDKPNYAYTKQPIYLDQIGRKKLSPRILASRGALIAREAAVCERIRARPYFGLADDRGVISFDKKRYTFGKGHVDIPLNTVRVLGIVFRCYDCTLTQLVSSGVSFNVENCLKAIAYAIEHLYWLGIVHSDIKPNNVFIKKTSLNVPDPYVWKLEDFDSAHDVGALMSLKGGTPGWARPEVVGDNVRTAGAQKDDDWYSFQKIKEWLIREKGGTLAM